MPLINELFGKALRVVYATIAAVLVAGFVPVQVVAGMSSDYSTTSSVGTLIVLNKAEASASLVDLTSGVELQKINTGAGPHEVAISPDGRLAVVTNYGIQTPGHTLTVIDLESKEVRRTIDIAPYSRPHGVEFLADGKSVVVTSEQSLSLLRVDIENGEITAVIDTSALLSHMVAVAPNGKRAFVANIVSGSVTAIDLTNNTMLKEIKTGSGAEGVAVLPDGNEVWVTNRAANSVSIIDARTLEKQMDIPCADFPLRVKFTPDGKYALVSNAQSADVAIFDVARRELIKRIAMKERAAGDLQQRLFSDQFGTSPVPVGIAIAGSGKRAYIANTNADIITILDLERLEIAGRLKAGKEPDGVGWFPLNLK